MENILVIFEATEERTEGLALALGLGAVQHGANIRLRHLNPSPIANLAHQSYGRLKVDDLLWAEGIAIVLETGEQTAIREIVQKVEQFSEMRDPVSRIVLVAGGDANSESVRSLHAKFARPEFRMLTEDKVNSTITLSSMSQIGQRFACENL